MSDEGVFATLSVCLRVDRELLAETVAVQF